MHPKTDRNSESALQSSNVSVLNNSSESGFQSSNVPVIDKYSESGFQSCSVPVSSSGSSTSNQVPVVQQNNANLSTQWWNHYGSTTSSTVNHSDSQRVPVSNKNGKSGFQSCSVPVFSSGSSTSNQIPQQITESRDETERRANHLALKQMNRRLDKLNDGINDVNYYLSNSYEFFIEDFHALDKKVSTNKGLVLLNLFFTFLSIVFVMMCIGLQERK